MATVTSDVTIPAGAAALAGTPVLPPKASGVVAFAHGSGSIASIVRCSASG